MARAVFCVYLCFITSMQITNNTSLSRSKTAQEYIITTPESILLPSDSPQETYDELMEEVPVSQERPLPLKLSKNRRTEYIPQENEIRENQSKQLLELSQVESSADTERTNGNVSGQFFDRSQVDFSADVAEQLDAEHSRQNASEEFFDLSQVDFKTNATEQLDIKPIATHPNAGPWAGSNHSEVVYDLPQIGFSAVTIKELHIKSTSDHSDRVRNTTLAPMVIGGLMSSGMRRLNKSRSLIHRFKSSNISSIKRPRFPKSRRLFIAGWFYDLYSGIYISSCYVCGLQKSLPTSYCYDAFESEDARVKTVARYARAECWNGYYGEHVQRRAPYWFRQFKYEDQRGLRMQYFKEHFMPGCVKRFLDIGTIYTERVCRHYWPWIQYGTFLTHRYGRLEAAMRHRSEGCAASHHASLVPYHRGVSLFARFHVCLCQGDYCNPAHCTSLQSLALLYQSLALQLLA